MHRFLSVCLSVWLGVLRAHYTPLQRYMGYLWTTIRIWSRCESKNQHNQIHQYLQLWQVCSLQRQVAFLKKRYCFQPFFGKRCTILVRSAVLFDYQGENGPTFKKWNSFSKKLHWGVVLVYLYTSSSLLYISIEMARVGIAEILEIIYPKCVVCLVWQRTNAIFYHGNGVIIYREES